MARDRLDARSRAILSQGCAVLPRKTAHSAHPEPRNRAWLRVRQETSLNNPQETSTIKTAQGARNVRGFLDGADDPLAVASLDAVLDIIRISEQEERGEADPTEVNEVVARAQFICDALDESIREAEKTTPEAMLSDLISLGYRSIRDRQDREVLLETEEGRARALAEIGGMDESERSSLWSTLGEAALASLGEEQLETVFALASLAQEAEEVSAAEVLAPVLPGSTRTLNRAARRKRARQIKRERNRASRQESATARRLDGSGAEPSDDVSSREETQRARERILSECEVEDLLADAIGVYRG